tara:strand:+ start:1281 stop:2348 length:1068 start_codon:yes stop_codon:yes gene_type:complete
MRKLIILQTITPDYRKIFFQTIKDELGENFELYGGDNYFETSIKDDVTIVKTKVNNFFFFNRKLLIQSHTLRLIFKKGLLVIELNPRILTNWIILIFRKLLNRKTIVWGHAWSREGKGSKTNNIRRLMKLLANQIVVYTNQQKRELLKEMPKKKIFSAPNAVFSSLKMKTNEDINESIINIIYVGRLSSPKKPFFLVEAFAKEINSYPFRTKLIIVGEGEEKEKIKKYIADNKLSKRIDLLGHISDYEKLKELYFTSLFSVSPGYVGLSITQSLGFGVPMLVSKSENHSPEIEALELNENGLFFNTNEIDSFNKVLLKAFSNKKSWVQKRQKIMASCMKNYSTETMADTFIKFVK